MSKWDKLIELILGLSGGLRFEELRIVLEAVGYEMCSSGSGDSHRTFRKAGCKPITIPVKNPVGRVYVKQVKEVVEKELGSNGKGR